MYIRTHIHTYTHAYVHIHTYINTYIHRYTHMDILKMHLTLRMASEQSFMEQN